MDDARRKRAAFGKPGIEPKWTQGNKDGVGTAYSGSSRLWFTIFRGVVTEVFYPTIDRPQLRDIQYLISDGKTFVHEEKRHLETRIARSNPHALSFRITNSERERRYSITKDVIADPHLPCLLQHTSISGNQEFLRSLRVYVLCAPHLQVGGWANNARVREVGGRRILTAEKGGIWLVLGATAPFSRVSCGYVGHSDGATDLNQHKRMNWEFDEALDGNVALTGELDLRGEWEFTTAVAFGDSFSSAISSLFQTLAVPFPHQMERYVEQWSRPCKHMLPLEHVSNDGGNLYHGSYSLLLSHEDKTYPGAFIASLSIPWGEAKGDSDQGGYHVVWTRDLVNTATGLLAAGNKMTPLRALIYLSASQLPDGRFPQNFWINGTPYWGGIQLDEVAFPILLAWRLRQEDALQNFDPYELVKRAACYLVRHGPVTKQERWEDSSGYSPSTLAACIAALICAGCFCLERRDTADGTVPRGTRGFPREPHRTVDGHDRGEFGSECTSPLDSVASRRPGRSISKRRSQHGHSHHPESASVGGVAATGKGDRGRRLSGTRALRRAPPRRSADRRLAAGCGRSVEGGNAKWTVLEAIQSRRLRAARGWRSIRRLGTRTRLAAAHR